MAPSPSCSPGWAGPLWSRPCGPSLARTDVEDAGVKGISLEISSSWAPCTILLIPAAAHRRGWATMPYTRTFAARLSVVYPMTPLLASPVRNLICGCRSGHAHSAPIRFVRDKPRTKPDYSTVVGTPGRTGRAGTGQRGGRGYRRRDWCVGAPVAGRAAPPAAARGGALAVARG